MAKAKDVNREYTDEELDMDSFTPEEQQQICDVVKKFMTDPANFEDEVPED